MIKQLAIIIAICLAVFTGASFIHARAARADSVGAVFGATSGLLLAGPPGLIIGAIVGAIWGKPFWGPHSPRACWIDERFHRHCPR